MVYFFFDYLAFPINSQYSSIESSLNDSGIFYIAPAIVLIHIYTTHINLVVIYPLPPYILGESDCCCRFHAVPGFDLTAPAFARSRTSYTVGTGGWLAKNGVMSPICNSPTSHRMYLLDLKTFSHTDISILFDSDLNIMTVSSTYLRLSTILYSTNCQTIDVVYFLHNNVRISLIH